ncbi:hypothetical protein Pan241w_52760 [Gimesia alba]|uniref:Double zinc ribbon n=1 Tax=Gimesia alba TaxID=2527973 RepID=A0A517RMP5_9PLAN|nr:hypothetical protein [Gimesia alba]QDT45157.1 hypothetical protein Pan241w_52760 [Gimesia alba]
MNPKSWQKSKEFINLISDNITVLMESSEFGVIQSQLMSLIQSLDKRYGVTINCVIDVIDWEKERILPLLNTGISTEESGDVFRTWNDALPQKYVVNGDIHVVPQDYCPNCWSDWGFKWKKRTCPECGIKLGEECKILLDSDVCPHCKDGIISMNNPVCDKCRFKIDPNCVVWG